MHNKKPLVISVCILLILCLALAAIVLLGGWKIKITLHGDSPMTLRPTEQSGRIPVPPPCSPAVLAAT